MAQIIDKSTFVLIERSDKVDQAISLNLAVKNNIWSSYLEKEGSNSEECDIKEQEIVDICYSIIDQNNIFEFFMVDSMASSVKLLYEDIVANPKSCLDRIAEKLGKPIPYMASNVIIKKQADTGKTANKTKLLSEVRSRLISA
ncbi:hypothetical protein NTCA1_47160 [Novosphingobium sp. TCA1]|nr:hypothetical protein NTCA1_47160 [Novosphingobium sp. TCA1]